jgi:hypothetical protein
MSGKEEDDRMTMNDRAQLTIEALEYLQTLPTKLLVAALRRDIDLNAIARRELASRGLDRDGRWVGFEKAREIHSFCRIAVVVRRLLSVWRHDDVSDASGGQSRFAILASIDSLNMIYPTHFDLVTG